MMMMEEREESRCRQSREIRERETGQTLGRKGKQLQCKAVVEVLMKRMDIKTGNEGGDLKAVL